MSEELVIAHGLVVNANGRRPAHVVIRRGRVSQVIDASLPVPSADRVINASGLIVIPGGVDAHCHIAQRTGSYLTSDSYAVSTAAALAGGTTTVMDFGIPEDSTQSPLQAAEYKMSLASEARCDVGLHASVIVWDDTVPDQLDILAERGIRSVKLYTTNRATTMADGDTMVKVLREMARIDGLSLVHAEHDEIIVDCTQQHADIGEVSIRDLPSTRPALAEEASVREVLAMAEYAGAAVYFVHQSTPGAVDLVTAARARGQAVCSETCPHYVALNDEVYQGPRPEFFACCPPMRDKATMLALRERLTSGAVNTIASDHSSYNLAQKRSHVEDLRLMPHGLPGVETRLPVTYSHMVDADLRGLETFVSAFATSPARINGLSGKGSISPGFDADLVIIDPHEEREVDSRDLHMGTDFSPFEGARLCGWPRVVISAGTVVLHDGDFADPGPVGRFLKQHPFSEAASWPELGLPRPPETDL